MSRDNDILYKIHENIVRADEKIKALVESTNKESQDTRTKIEVLTLEVKAMREDIEKLNIEGVKLSLFWKFLVIGAPIAISVMIQILFYIFGGK